MIEGNWEEISRHKDRYEGNLMAQIIEVTYKCLDCDGTGKDDEGKPCQNCDGEGFLTIQE
jgi:DnaJ-class molecular chaperone